MLIASRRSAHYSFIKLHTTFIRRTDTIYKHRYLTHNSMLHTSVLIVLFALLVSSAQQVKVMADSITLVDFADVTPAIAMQTVDDPVMGGKSSSSCHNVVGESLVWEGTVRIVDFLKAPGFCNLRSNRESRPECVGEHARHCLLRKEIYKLLLSSNGNQSSKWPSHVSWHSHYIFGASQGVAKKMA